MAELDDDVEDTPKSLTLFGRDLSKITCFRESFINGIIGGVAIGIGTFMRTSRPRQACNYAMGSYTMITLFYWSYCRYSYSKEKFFVAQVQEGMRRQALYQGTDLEREIRADFEKNDVDVKDA
ncbi:cytochrome c oxidase assembly protein COX20, mitochondrial [Contarinia nasturtii]|uniref:cytochrome c oxidase assembly protein COX20, mitochondrial n=1 Tax=Contarinia nasturtii TaxID=265458 RepID=UPI0012D44E4D|nr:cytochrome c oxidase assembly protein COX20, mitochondrial [Contarinia nasturtii]